MSPVSEAVRLNPNSGWGISESSGVLSVSANPPNLPNVLVISANIVNKSGQSPSNAYLRRACSDLPSGGCRLPSGGPGVSHVSVTPSGQQAFQQCIDAVSAHFHQFVVYQPANRFWTFQAYETVLFVIASAALAGVCLWWVRLPTQLTQDVSTGQTWCAGHPKVVRPPTVSAEVLSRRSDTGRRRRIAPSARPCASHFAD